MLSCKDLYISMQRWAKSMGRACRDVDNYIITVSNVYKRPLAYRTFLSREFIHTLKKHRCVTSWSGSRRAFHFDVVWTGFSSYFSIRSHRTHGRCLDILTRQYKRGLRSNSFCGEMDNFQDPQLGLLRTFSPSQMCWPNACIFFLPDSKPYTFGKFPSARCLLNGMTYTLMIEHGRTFRIITLLCARFCDIIALSFLDPVDLYTTYVLSSLHSVLLDWLLHTIYFTHF